jgi:hypothetical protein
LPVASPTFLFFSVFALAVAKGARYNLSIHFAHWKSSPGWGPTGVLAECRRLDLLPESSLAVMDIATVNLFYASGLPGSLQPDMGKCLQWVNAAASLVLSETDRHMYRFRNDPEKYGNSEGAYRMSWLVTVLQRELGVHYRQELIDMDDHSFFKRSEHLFIHGIVEGKGGTCASLPVMYAAVGRRLGYPLKLAACARHLFVRWEGQGERFNIESTCRGYISYPDEYYLTWPHAIPPEKVAEFGYLKSQTPNEEVSDFLCHRAHVLLEHGQHGDAVGEYLRAFFRAPGRKSIVVSLAQAVVAWTERLRAQIGEGFPGLEVCNHPNRHQALPVDLQTQINYLNALQAMLTDPVRKQQWWDPLRRNPKVRLMGMPEWIRVTYPTDGGPLRFEGCEKPRSLVI